MAHKLNKQLKNEDTNTAIINMTSANYVDLYGSRSKI